MRLSLLALTCAAMLGCSDVNDSQRMAQDAYNGNQWDAVLSIVDDKAMADPAIKALATAAFIAKKGGMTIEKKQFSCEYISDKGKCFKFDDATCLFHYLHDNNIGDSAIAKIYVADYNQPDSLIDIQRASLVLGEFQTPMNGGVAAFKVAAQASKFAKENNAILLDSWERLKITH